MKKRIFTSMLSLLLVMATLFGYTGIVSAASNDQFYIEGAQIRTTEPQGIRFVAHLDKGLYNLTYGKDANFGILIARKDQLPAGAEITMENATAVPAVNLLEETDTRCSFTVVITNQPAEYYGVELLARAYVIEDGTVHYSNQISRSIKQVADLILEQNRDPDDVAVAQEVLAKYREVGADTLVSADSLFNQLVVYPEYPEQIARDYTYSVTVEQGSRSEELVVYNQTEAYFYQDRFDGGDTNRRFCEFAFSGKPVTVHIRVNRDFDTYAVVPTSKGFASTYADGVISVTLTKPEQFLIILDDDVNTALAVFADEPETDVPVKGASDVIYVEGWNNVTIGSNTDATLENGVLTINGQYAQLYIAPGAVLTARVVTTSDAYAAKIFGRGALLDPSSLIYQESDHGFDNATSTSTKFVSIQGYTSVIKDVKLLDSRGYNLFIERGNCTVQNVKILSTMMTTDGITTNAEGGSGIVKDCFVYCGDNALVTTVDVTKEDPGYSFSNITVGTTCSAIYPQHGVRSTFTDIYVFRADESLIAMKETSDSAKYLTVENLDALDCVKTPMLFYAQNQGTAEKVLTLKQVLMRYTTGSKDISEKPGTSTNEKTMIEFGDNESSNFTINATDLYVGGTLITNQSQIKVSGSDSLTLTLSKNAETPSVLSGSKYTANYTCTNKVMIGERQIFLKNAPIAANGTWYLPYDEIVSYLAIAPSNPTINQTVGGLKVISLANLLASGAVTAANYENGIIQLTPAINASVNLLKDDYTLSSNYNLLYYRSKTPYLVADYENDTWVYSAASNDYDGSAGIFRMILDEYRQYGAGTYSLTFEYKSNVKLTVALGKDHEFVSCGTANASSSSYTSKTITFELTDDPSELEQLAICFKIPIKESWLGDDEPGTLSIRNISLTKTS